MIIQLFYSFHLYFFIHSFYTFIIFLRVEYQVEGQSHRASGSVILATGGYGADFTDNGLLKKYRPDVLPLPTTNGDHTTGDGNRMIERKN